jgi:hypothetical protein
VFGSKFQAAFVFAYWITDPDSAQQHPVQFEYRGRQYAFYAVWVRDYARMMRQRSPKWRTVVLPSRAFRALRRPWGEFIG